MCGKCTEQWAACSEAEKDDMAGHVRVIQSSVVCALADAKEDPVNVFAAATFIANYYRAQLGPEVAAIGDDLAARCMTAFVAQLAEKGMKLEPRPHSFAVEKEPRPPAAEEVDLSRVPEEAREQIANLVADFAARGIPVSIRQAEPTSVSLGMRNRPARGMPERPSFVRRAPRPRRS